MKSLKGHFILLFYLGFGIKAFGQPLAKIFPITFIIKNDSLYAGLFLVQSDLDHFFDPTSVAITAVIDQITLYNEDLDTFNLLDQNHNSCLTKIKFLHRMPNRYFQVVIVVDERGEIYNYEFILDKKELEAYDHYVKRTNDKIISQ